MNAYLRKIAEGERMLDEMSEVEDLIHDLQNLKDDVKHLMIFGVDDALEFAIEDAKKALDEMRDRYDEVYRDAVNESREAVYCDF